jgi:hypothetical protein
MTFQSANAVLLGLRMVGGPSWRKVEDALPYRLVHCFGSSEKDITPQLAAVPAFFADPDGFEAAQSVGDLVACVQHGAELLRLGVLDEAMVDREAAAVAVGTIEPERV